MIKNTSKSPNLEWLGGGNPHAIENQEAEGQKELCKSASQLPRGKGFGRDDAKVDYENLGIKVLGISKGDEIWYDVILPEGWKIEPTDHSMWSKLLDNKGKERASIFYKAAFYDRDCFIHFTS